MGFSRQESWSGLPFPSPGYLPDPAIEPASPALQADSLLLSHQGSIDIVTRKNSLHAPLILYSISCSKPGMDFFNESWNCLSSSLTHHLLCGCVCTCMSVCVKTIRLFNGTYTKNTPHLFFPILTRLCYWNHHSLSKNKWLRSHLVVATHSGKQTHSGQCREWSAVYYSGGPKAESPLSQGPRAVFVKTWYTLSV